MGVRLRNYWEEVRSSYWFLPAVLVLAAIALSFVTLAIDERVRLRWVQTVGVLWAGGPEGARSLLSAIAGSMITVASIVFSITMVALSNASSQFGPRLLRNFMRSTTNQVVLGTFVSAFIYPLLVLRTIRTGDGSEFVPYISVTTSLLLALAGLGVLIYFIHHAALSMQAPIVIAEVAEDLFAAIERVFPEAIGRAPTGDSGDARLPADFETNVARVPAAGDGYVQAVDNEGLLRLAREHDVLVQLLVRPGHFATQENELMRVWPAGRLDGGLAQKLQKTVLIGKQRTNTQDLEYAVDQLVEVAVRALSPGINDPFTAIACVDWLSAALTRLAQKDFPAPYRYDDDGGLRVVVEHPETFVGVIEAAFNQIRQHAAREVSVALRLLEAIARIAAVAPDPEARRALQRQAQMIVRQAEETVGAHVDREAIAQRYHELQVALAQPAEPLSQPNGQE